MLETAIDMNIREEALEKIQNLVRNAKVGVTEYFNDYVKGKYDAVTSISATGELLKTIGERINEHIQTIESTFSQKQ